MEDLVESKFLCPHASSDGSKHIQKNETDVKSSDVRNVVFSS